MTKEEYLSIAASKYEELQSLKKIDNFYDYEKEFEIFFIDFARTVLEENLGKPSATGVKKTLTKFGYIEINNQHAFSNGMNGFQIGPLLQEHMVYFGQLECYKKCPEIIEKQLG